MKLAAIILTAFTLAACSGDTAPRAPTVPDPPAPNPPRLTPPGPPPPGPSASTTFVWGFIVDGRGGCIPGATARVVRGQRAGESFPQSTPCDVWDYANGFEIERLTPYVAMTIRASAPGYADLEREIVPTLGWQTAFVFALSRQ